MPDRWLKEIKDIEGVEGVFVASNKGQLIQQVGLSFDHATLEGVAVHLLRIISAHYLLKRNVKEIEIIWDKYRVIAKNANEFIVISFCNSVKALPLLRITSNVVLAHLLEDKKFMKRIKKHASERTILLRRGNLEPLEINFPFLTILFFQKHVF